MSYSVAASSGHSGPRSIVNISVGYMLARAVHVAVALNVPDHLGSGSKTVEELGALTGAHVPSLHRLLLTLESFGVFALQESRFALTPISEPLRSDVPGSVREFVLGSHAEWQTRAWEHALYSVQTGESAFRKAHGKSLFEYLDDHPSQRVVFDASMKNHTELVLYALLANCDFPAGSRIVDVGGGDGTFLIEILRRRPTCTGTVFDLEATVRNARHRQLPGSVAGRIEFVAGDVFAGMPRDADIYILKHVLHDFDDERAAQILRRCSLDMGPDSRVLIAESLLQSGRSQPHQRLLDLGMMMVTGGRERSESEFCAMCETSGLQVSRVVRNGGPYAFIEARRALPAGG